MIDKQSILNSLEVLETLSNTNNTHKLYHFTTIEISNLCLSAIELAVLHKEVNAIKCYVCNDCTSSVGVEQDCSVLHNSSSCVLSKRFSTGTGKLSSMSKTKAFTLQDLMNLCYYVSVIGAVMFISLTYNTKFRVYWSSEWDWCSG